MSWFKLHKQAAAVKLEKGTHTQSGKTIYFLSGDTYPLHKAINLGKQGLGFTFWRTKKIWWTYNLKPHVLRRLKKAGVDVSAVDAYPAETSTAAPVAPAIEEEQPQPQPEETALSPIDRSWDFLDTQWKEKELSQKAGFPVKTIYEQTITIPYQGQEVPLYLSLNRRVAKGKSRYGDSVAKGWKHVPLYNVTVNLNDKDGTFIGKIPLPVNRKKDEPKQRWQQIDEAALIPQMIEIANSAFANEASKAYRLLSDALQVQGRDPEFEQFLKAHEKYNDEGGRNPGILKSIRLDEPGYEGDYPVSFSKLSNDTWYGDIALEHPQAPSYKPNAFYLQMPTSIQTVDAFNQWLETEINDPENLETAKRNYLKYLKSFPFLEEEAEEAKGQLGEIVAIIEAKFMDARFFRNKLLEHGYIRPSKRQKKTGPGMQVQEKIQMILDREAIMNGIYTSSKTRNTPDFFYAALAYFMLRHKDSNIGFMPIQIIDNVRRLADVISRFGTKIDSGDLYDYMDGLAKKMLNDLFGIHAGGSAWDQWQAFYGGGGYGQQQQQVQPQVVQSDALAQFADFASRHGFDFETAKTQPKAIYRQLALKIHPDKNPDNPEQATEEFKALQFIWNQLPDTLKQAITGWWKRFKSG